MTKHDRRRKMTVGQFLKLTRVAVSVAMLLLITVLATTLEARVALALDWAAHVQLVPLALAGATTAVALWLAMTLIFGRLYCSSGCPMGALQDCFSHLRRITVTQRRHHPFHYSLPRNRLRYALLTVVAGSAVVGVSLLVSIFDPYSAFMRIASEVVRPAVELASGSPVAVASCLAFCVACATLFVVGWTAYIRGRLICNTVCPVGAMLGLFSRYALFHFDIDTDMCVNCRKCERACKAECINMADHVVDGSRCVVCFNCVDACDNNAIRYTFRRKKLSLPMMQRVENATSASIVSPAEDTRINDNAVEKKHAVKIDRRQFLATGAVVALAPAIAAAENGRKRISAIATGSVPLKKARAVAPPGRRSMAEFLERCTGCGLCVAHCPAKVLHPSSNQLGWLHMLHPVMDFEKSYCRYNCTRCTEVCPSGALLPLTVEEKHIFIIGHAKVEGANCIGCGLCASRCPRAAITMAVRPKSEPGRGVMIARVDTTVCIGCGACEYICPATPVKAIGVNGIA